MVSSDKNQSDRKANSLERFGLWLASFLEKWFPDAWIFALVGIIIVFIFGLLIGEKPTKLLMEGGKSFWSLVPFTMQMVFIIIGGYVVATTPSVYWLIRKASGITTNPRLAIAFIALFSLLTSLISWGFSLIFSGLLVREMTRTVKGMDYRAAGAAAYLGLGPMCALGLSSSAGLMMATKEAIPAKLYEISGLLPLTQTIFTWANFWIVVALVTVPVVVSYFSAPQQTKAKTIDDFGLKFEPIHIPMEPKHLRKPGEWLEYSPLLIIIVGVGLGWYLYTTLSSDPKGLWAVLNLTNYNLLFITVGMLLHWRPRRFLKSVSQAIPATGGVLIQFPFYAIIFGFIVGTGINKWLADFFTTITTKESYSLLVAIYSATLGFFIPSAGSKWIIEAPYLLQAAIHQHVNLGFIVIIYNAAEALPNFLNPFWMLPLLGLLHLKARDLVGYTVLLMIFQIPVSLFLCWYFGLSLPFVPPIK